MIAEQVALWLHAQGVVDYRADVAGGNCFIDHVPDAPDQLLSLWGTPGPRPDGRLGWDIVGLQARCRGTSDPKVSSDKCLEIYDWLHGRDDFTLPDGTYVVGITAVQSSPMPIGQDKNGRHEHTMNFDIDVRALTRNRE